MPRQGVQVDPDARRIVTDQPALTALAITYVDIDEVVQWPGNPKEHDLGAITESMLRFGFRDPIAVNRRNHEIEEGHGRTQVLIALRSQGREAPRFIEVNEHGAWRVPIMYFDDDDITQRGYALAHNRTQELGGGYDDRKLLAAIREQANYGQLLGTGFDGDDISALQKRLAQLDGGAEDQTAELRTQFQVLVTCATEQEQAELLERLANEGLTVRALTS